MKQHILKMATQLFFLCLIVSFVAYKSGLFQFTEQNKRKIKDLYGRSKNIQNQHFKLVYSDSIRSINSMDSDLVEPDDSDTSISQITSNKSIPAPVFRNNLDKEIILSSSKSLVIIDPIPTYSPAQISFSQLNSQQRADYFFWKANEMPKFKIQSKQNPSLELFKFNQK